MKKSLVLSGIAIASLVVCLVVKVPASFVWQKLKTEELVPASIELEGVRGTVWSGAADKVLFDGRLLPALEWSFVSFSPLDLTVGYDVWLGNVRSDLFFKGNITVGQNSITVQDVMARIAANYFEQWLDIPFPVELQGRTSIAISELHILNGQCDQLNGNGRLSSIKAVSQWGALDLGKGSVEFSCNQREITATVKQSSLELTSNLELGLDYSGRYSVSGWVKPGVKLDSRTGHFLQFAGEADGKGAVQIKYLGRI